MAQSLRKKQRVRLIAVLSLALLIAVVLIGYGFRSGIEFFMSPTDVVASPPQEGSTFRIGGLVESGSLVKSGEAIRFQVTDGNETVEVSFVGILPDLFDEGQGMIATGSMKDNIFIAKTILAKHDENYMPREVIDALKEQGHFKPTDSKSNDY